MVDELGRRCRRWEMVTSLRKQGIHDAGVLHAMAEVPRDRFVASDLADRAYEPCAVPIGSGQTMSSPWIVATMVEALRLTGTERVLEVGTGSGYAAAILSRSAREVVTVETRGELVESARRSLTAVGCRNVTVLHADGTWGLEGQAPFDAVSVAAMVDGEIPDSLLAALTDSGTIVCPVGHGRTGNLVRRHHAHTQVLAPVAFVPLRRSDERPGGQPADPRRSCASADRRSCSDSPPQTPKGS